MEQRIARSIALSVVALVPFVAIVHFAGSGTHKPSAPHTPSTRTPSTTDAHSTARVPQKPRPATPAFPSATDFGHIVAGAANQYGQEHGDPTRITVMHCVQASPGHYMCSYAAARPGARKECHLIQARWTPDATSTFTVTLSGRAAQCGSLREALDSLE
jgi:hypothetical protein